MRTWVDLYGWTEAGYIFVGDAFADNSRVIDENAFVELVPYRGSGDVFQIHVTTRGRQAMRAIFGEAVMPEGAKRARISRVCFPVE